ncbi:MAG: hypothetical protein DLM58_00765 [Pseudonocardiales bacterium]|nr:MAG: hypothetical protein DLM58_00765 [Pseudonocardiales bacterium]
MDRDELFASLAEAAPSPDDVLYVERRGESYSWHRVTPDAESPPVDAGPDVWMYFSGAWPQHDSVRLCAFCEDMLAEMESMAGGDDRCRWPVEQPWPMTH